MRANRVLLAWSKETPVQPAVVWQEAHSWVKPAATWFGFAARLKSARWHPAQSEFVPVYWPPAWHWVQAACTWAPVNWKRAKAWSKRAPGQPAVVWQSAQLVGNALRVWSGFFVACVVARVAAVTILAGAGVDAIGVAGGAVDLLVSPGEREPGHGGMVETGARPGGRVVAGEAGRGKPGLDVIDGAGGRKVRVMATEAFLRGPVEGAAGMAPNTIHIRVRGLQWEAREPGVVKPCPGEVVHPVTQVAGEREVRRARD